MKKISFLKLKLRDIGKIRMCKRIFKYQTLKKGDIPFFKISTFGGKPDSYIKKEIFEEYRKKYSFPKKGDILISASGTIGKTVIYDGKPAYFQDSNIVWLDNNEKKILNIYLYYFYKTKPWLKTHGSTISRLYNNNLEDLNILFPEDLNYQQKIASVLSALDEKIELNNKINEELEKMAKLLYDYWFVQFEFPDENGRPYKSSGGKMVWNEELKREIPAGWEMKRLKNLFVFEKGIEPGKKQYLEKPIDNTYIRFYRVQDIEKDNPVFVKFENKYKIAKEDDILVTFDGSVGKILFGINGVFSGGFRRVFDKSNKIKSSLIYLIFNDKKVIADIKKYATGSILLHANKSIDYLKIPFNEDIYLKFQNIINPIFNLIVKNKIENNYLANLRDWLLPMLMNGQVVVE